MLYIMMSALSNTAATKRTISPEPTRHFGRCQRNSSCYKFSQASIQTGNHLAARSARGNTAHCSNIITNSNLVSDTPNILQLSSFWDNYKIFNSPGDGHCLLYSVVTSYNNQLDRVDKLSINNLKHIMYKEVQDNFYINYHEFCVNPSYDDFYKELGEYI